MMQCKEYIFLITSGKLDEATKMQKAWAKLHGMMCPHCGRFTKNDQKLSRILKTQKNKIIEKFE